MKTYFIVTPQQYNNWLALAKCEPATIKRCNHNYGAIIGNHCRLPVAAVLVRDAYSPANGLYNLVTAEHLCPEHLAEAIRSLVYHGYDLRGNVPVSIVRKILLEDREAALDFGGRFPLMGGAL